MHVGRRRGGALLVDVSPANRVGGGLAPAEHLRNGREVRAVLQPDRDRPDRRHRRVHPRMRRACAAPTILSCPWNGPPVLDPTTLPACDGAGCSGAHCLPAAEVPQAEQSQLARCNNGAGFCTPDPIISTANHFIPTSCDPFPGSGAAGRCLSDCLPEVQAESASGTLVQATCATGQYCVPCNDPFTGVSTGACTLGCDTPPPTAFTFPKCCDDGSGSKTGTCVPTAQVPSAELSELSQSGNGNSSPCPTSGASYLCVPDEYLPAPYNSIALQGCPATFANLCGVCVSQCIVNSELSLLGPSDCAADHKCVPCKDPYRRLPGCATATVFKTRRTVLKIRRKSRVVRLEQSSYRGRFTSGAAASSEGRAADCRS